MRVLVFSHQNPGDGVKKQELSFIDGGNVNLYSHFGNQCGCLFLN
jgi:hypothetical protein